METTVALGRIAGIRVGVHWSVIAIWWLLTWSLATTLLPEEAPGQADIAYWAVAALASFSLLACLLAHELSHALVARRHGVGTEAITLWVLGGVAKLKDESPSPQAELRIAAAGPLASLVVAALAGVVLIALELSGASMLLTTAVGWLVVINVALAVFNLIPGFPLDGGRVLHAWLWHRTGDRIAATARAASIGRVIGYTLIGLGLLQFSAGYWGGLWLVVVGWFLTAAATTESRMDSLKAALDGVRVVDVMTPDPDTLPDDLSLQRFLDDYVLQLRHSSFPVRGPGGELTGLITLASVKGVPAAERPSTPLHAAATPMDEVPTAHPDELVLDVLGRIQTAANRTGRVLVLDRTDGHLVGIVTPTDMARVLEYASLTRG